MGVCASSQYAKNYQQYGRSLSSWPHTTQIIHIDGSLQELRHSVRAHQILSQNPKTFLCSWETLFVGKLATQVGSDEDLQLGQIYFLMPLSQSRSPLSLKDLCALAVKASTALSDHFSVTSFPVSEAQPLGCCKVAINGLDHMEPADHSRRIDF